MAKAVVASPEAAEGIRTQDEAALLVAQNAAAFVEKLLALLAGNAAAGIGAAARASVLRDYGWDANLARLDECLSAQARPTDPRVQEAAA